jgi:hypothetical protein
VTEDPAVAEEPFTEPADDEPTGAEPADDPGERGSGHAAVDAAVKAVEAAADLPPADQIEAYEAAHHTLQETLATIDQA